MIIQTRVSLMSTTVSNQEELDQALADKTRSITIDSSPDGVWLQIYAADSSQVVARGSAHVEAWDSAHVEAWDSAHVEAWGSAHVEAWGSAHVEAWGSAHVEARGSAQVEAWDSAQVEAWDSAHVVAWGSAHVEARGSAHVEAWDSAHVVAAKYVAVHLHSQQVTLSGGVVIDMTSVDATDFDAWCDLTGITPRCGWITVYKAVDRNLYSGQGFEYPIGATVTDPAWRDDHECGGGLHGSPTPVAAREYFQKATRFLECRIAVDDVRCIDSSKIKARSMTVVREVDLWSRQPIVAAVQP